jgi:hypothetical protein
MPMHGLRVSLQELRPARSTEFQWILPAIALLAFLVQQGRKVQAYGVRRKSACAGGQQAPARQARRVKESAVDAESLRAVALEPTEGEAKRIPAPMHAPERD